VSRKDEKRLIASCDAGIREAVRILRENGAYTIESCEGGSDHAFPEPTIVFGGNYAEGIKVLGAALFHGLPVSELRRRWRMIAGELEGPMWEMVFYKKMP
jgi:hypothetical protein